MVAGRYRATLASGLVDLAGNARSLPLSWDFATGAFPRVQEVFPPQNFVRVGALLDELRYAFDQPVSGTLAKTYVWTVSRKIGNDFKAITASTVQLRVIAN